MTKEELLDILLTVPKDPSPLQKHHALEYIRQFGKALCEEQMWICSGEFSQARDRSYNQQMNAILESPYPKDLQ